MYGYPWREQKPPTYFKSEQALVNEIDPSLCFVENLAYTTHRPVYRVTRERNNYVLKASAVDIEFNRRHLKREVEVLRRTKHIPGVVHLTHDYGQVGSYLAILRQYVSGQDIYQSRRPLSTEFHALLVETIKALHDDGIANLEIKPHNVVNDQTTNRPTVVDLGHASLSTEIATTEFEEMKELDIANASGLLVSYM